MFTSIIKTAVTNKTLQSTLMYGISILFMKGLSLILLPFLTHNLTLEEYGRLEVFATLATVGSVVAGFGLAETLFRYCGLSKGANEENAHASRLLSLSVIIAFIIGVTSFITSDFIAQLIPGGASRFNVNLVLLMISFEALIAVSLGWLRMQNKVSLFCVITCARALLQILLTYTFVSKGLGVSGMLLAGLISCSMQALVLLYFLREYLTTDFLNSSVKPYFVYGLPVMLSGGVAFLLFGVDKWFLATYSSLENVAIYAVAAKLALAVVIVLQPFTMWWSPKRFQLLSTKGEGCIVKYIYLGFVILGNISIALSGVSLLLIDTLVPPQYYGAVHVIAPLIITMLLKEVVEFVNIGCFVGTKCQSQLYINMACAVVLCIMLMVFTPLYGLYAVAWSLCLGQLLRVIAFFIVSQKHLPLNYAKLPLLLLLTFTLSAITYLPEQESTIQALLLTPCFLFAFNILAAMFLFRDKRLAWFKVYQRINKLNV